MATEIIVGMGSGEVSRNIESRVNLDLYKMACSIAENADILPEGGAAKKAGTEFIAFAKDVSSPSHLKSFSFSDEFSYQLEFSHYGLRIFRVQDSSILQELPSPYTVEQARDVQFHRQNDVMWLTHPDVPEQILSRISISSFTFAEAEYSYPPLMEYDIRNYTMLPAARTGSGIGLQCSAPYFEEGHIGGFIALNQLRIGTNIIGTTEFGPSYIGATVAGTGSGVSPVSLWTAFSGFKVKTSGTAWRGRLAVQESVDGGTIWKEIYYIIDNTGSGTAENFAGLDFDKRRGAQSQIRLAWDLSVGGLDYTLSVNESYNHGLAKIVGVTDGINATIDIVSDLFDNSAVDEWYEGAFSPRNGYPRCVAIYEGFRYLIGNSIEPVMVWRSHLDVYDNFKIGTNPDEGIRRRPPANGAVCFIVPKDSLIMVTTQDVYSIDPMNPSEPIGPDNIRFVRHTGDGSAYAQAELANEAVLFTQKGSKKFREMRYSEDVRGYVTNDISALAKHITKRGIVETALSKLPEQRAFCVLEDHELGIVNYERAEKFVAWQRYVANGGYYSVSVADNGEEDAVWFCMERNGNYTIEKQKSRALDSEWMLDSAVSTSDLVPCQEADSIVVGPAPDYRIIVTKIAHGLIDGNKIQFKDVSGWDYLEDRVFTVEDATADTFVLKSEDGTIYISPYDFYPDSITGILAGTLPARGQYDDIEGDRRFLMDGQLKEESESFLINKGTFISTETVHNDPSGITFNPDGTVMYLANGSPGYNLYAYQLGTPWDPASKTEIASVNIYPGFNPPVGSSPADIRFSGDGLILWMLDIDQRTIWEYALLTAWDITTLQAPVNSSGNLLTLTGRVPTGFDISADGTRVFLSADEYVISCLLVLAYDISSIGVSEELSTAPALGEIRGIFLHPSGLSFCVCDETANSVCEYVMPSPYMLLSAALENTLDVSAISGNPMDIFINPDRDRLLLVDSADDAIHSWGLLPDTIPGTFEVVRGREWVADDISDSTEDVGARYSLASGVVEGNFYMSANGEHCYYVDKTNVLLIRQLDLSTPWDLNTAVDSGYSYAIPSETNMRLAGIAVIDGGTRLWVSKYYKSVSSIIYDWRVQEYTLATPYRVSTAVIGAVYDPTYDGWYGQLWVREDGLEWATGSVSGIVYHKIVAVPPLSSPVPYDLAASEMVYEIYDTPDFFVCRGVYFSPNGFQFIVVYNGFIKIWNLSTAYDARTRTAGPEIDLDYDGTQTGIVFKPDGTKFYATTSHTNHYIVQWDTNIIPTYPGWSVGWYPDSGGYDLLYKNPAESFLPPPKTNWVAVQGDDPPIEFTYDNMLVNAELAGTFCNVAIRVTGLDHLEGMEVVSLVNEKAVGSHVVVAGAVDLDQYGHAIVGLPYRIIVSPLPIELLPRAISSGHVKIVGELCLKLKDSYGGKVGTDLEKLQALHIRLLEDPIGEVPELFNGDEFVNIQDSWENIKRIYIVQDLPYPFEILSLSMQIEMGRRG